MYSSYLGVVHVRKEVIVKELGSYQKECKEERYKTEDFFGSSSQFLKNRNYAKLTAPVSFLGFDVCVWMRIANDRAVFLTY